MADRRVKYILEVDYEGENVLLRAQDDLRDVDKAARESKEGLEASASGFDKLQLGALALAGGLVAAQGALSAVAGAAKFAYEALGEGAALLDAQGDFADLAEGIGATADVLQNDLAAATAGLKTDAQLIAESSELMALNLGLTQEEIVRLSGAAAELDWDFGKLTDTLNTGSTRGLKEMGISIAEVKARTDELAESGMAADKAFTWAIIEAGEAKIDRVGKKSEEASGQIQILTVAVENAQDAFALGFAEGFAATLADIAGTAPQAASSIALVAGAAGSVAGEGLGKALDYMMMTNPAMQQLIVRGAELQAEQLRTAAAVGRTADELARQQYYMRDAAEATAELSDEMERVSFQGETAMLATQAYAEGQERWARTAEWARDETERAAAADYARANALAAEAAQLELATAAADLWAAQTAEMTSRGGDYFTQFTDGGFELAEALYAAADAAGAGIGPLSELAVQYDLIDQSAADAATAAAQQQAIIDSLAGAAAAGIITWENYAAAVETAIAMLNEVETRPPVEIPDMADRGFRSEIEGIAEQIEPVEVPLELQLENEAIEAAVAEARGIVEGFTQPSEVYEAVMGMDISAVEEGGTRIAAIIDGLPTEKTITINFQATGEHILEELRALGALP